MGLETNSTSHIEIRHRGRKFVSFPKYLEEINWAHNQSALRETGEIGY